jgi:hypothetical protein
MTHPALEEIDFDYATAEFSGTLKAPANQLSH